MIAGRVGLAPANRLKLQDARTRNSARQSGSAVWCSGSGGSAVSSPRSSIGSHDSLLDDRKSVAGGSGQGWSKDWNKQSNEDNYDVPPSPRLVQPATPSVVYDSPRNLTKRCSTEETIYDSPSSKPVNTSATSTTSTPALHPAGSPVFLGTGSSPEKVVSPRIDPPRVRSALKVQSSDSGVCDDYDVPSSNQPVNPVVQRLRQTEIELPPKSRDSAPVSSQSRSPPGSRGSSPARIGSPSQRSRDSSPTQSPSLRRRDVVDAPESRRRSSDGLSTGLSGSVSDLLDEYPTRNALTLSLEAAQNKLIVIQTQSESALGQLLSFVRPNWRDVKSQFDVIRPQLRQSAESSRAGIKDLMDFCDVCIGSALKLDARKPAKKIKKKLVAVQSLHSDLTHNLECLNQIDWSAAELTGTERPKRNKKDSLDRLLDACKKLDQAVAALCETLRDNLPKVIDVASNEVVNSRPPLPADRPTSSPSVAHSPRVHGRLQTSQQRSISAERPAHRTRSRAGSLGETNDIMHGRPVPPIPSVHDTPYRSSIHSPHHASPQSANSTPSKSAYRSASGPSTPDGLWPRGSDLSPWSQRRGSSGPLHPASHPSDPRVINRISTASSSGDRSSAEGLSQTPSSPSGYPSGYPSGNPAGYPLESPSRVAGFPFSHGGRAEQPTDNDYENIETDHKTQLLAKMKELKERRASMESQLDTHAHVDTHADEQTRTDSTLDDLGPLPTEDITLLQFYSCHVDNCFQTFQTTVRQLYTELAQVEQGRSTAARLLQQSRPVLASAHRLLYVGDLLQCSLQHQQLKSRIVDQAAHLCDSLKVTVTSVKSCAVEQNTTVLQQLVDNLVDVCYAARSLHVTITLGGTLPS